MKRKEFEQRLQVLQGDLVALQHHVVQEGLRVCVVFEGRDAAGKGGAIRHLTERVSPRVFRTVALPAPTEREKTQLYIQRYVPHLPAAGEVVVFDRSWYNRAGVERVMGFATPEQVEGFLTDVPRFEQVLVDDGVVLVKYWLEVGPDEQTRRFERRLTDPRRRWKLSPMDLESHHRWYDYSRARDEMLARTHTAWAPWTIVPSDDKRSARLAIIADLLARVPSAPLPPQDLVLPRRQDPAGYVEPALGVPRIAVG
ncbi:MAG: polyphosphate kinase 2 [Thermoleophilia bacterium]|jgi:polyphosphate kinase 2|nr:polyphosphate kinase 2 [Thermoleophilia bacterium]